jgi:hypothetical protein
MSELQFATLFDHNYLPRGLVLYDSLREYCPTATLHVLCLSQECFEFLLAQNLPQLIVTKLIEVEEFDPQLVDAKQNRTWVEYIFTLSPAWPLYLFSRYPEMDMVTTVDCDTSFFSDPTLAMRHMDNYSVGIVGHRFPKRLKHLEIYGVYNVGFQSFRRDKVGLECLNWWRLRCLEWCEDRLEGDRFAEQKYLDRWPEMFGAVEFPEQGINVAPWNVDSFSIGRRNGTICINDEPLIFYHFAQLRPIWGCWMNSGLFDYRSTMTESLRRDIYSTYLTRLHKRSMDYFQKSVFGSQGLRNPRPRGRGRFARMDISRRLLKLKQGIRAFLTGTAVRY